MLNLCPGADINSSTAGAISLQNTGPTINNARRGEVRTRNKFHQVINGQRFIFQQGQAAIDHLRHIVWWNIGGHTHGNTGRTVHQKVRYPGRQHGGDLFRAVVVRHVINGLFIQIGQQLMGDLVHADFRITHRCGGVSVNGAKVTLTIDQHVTQRKRLRHTNDGVVYG